jgi:hypothetical protein
MLGNNLYERYAWPTRSLSLSALSLGPQESVLFHLKGGGGHKCLYVPFALLENDSSMTKLTLWVPIPNSPNVTTKIYGMFPKKKNQNKKKLCFSLSWIFVLWWHKKSVTPPPKKK